MWPFSRRRELSIPPDAGSKSTEVARVWLTDGAGMCVSLRDTALGDDFAAWGMVLVDLARHLANAHEQRTGIDARVTFERIVAGFDVEARHPTDEVSGEARK